MRKLLFISLLVAIVALPFYALAGNEDFNASRTFEFDPDHTGCPVAYWRNGIGLADSRGNTNFGLRLEKNCAITVNASAGAVLNGISGTIISTGPNMGYDIKDTSPCEAGSPRFNVQQADGSFHFVGGCANGNRVSLGNGWSRVTFNPQDPTDSFPVLTPGVPVSSVVLIVDDPGQYTLDNIQINGLYAEKPGSSR